MKVIEMKLERDMDLVKLFFQMVTFTKEIMLMERGMVK